MVEGCFRGWGFTVEESGRPHHSVQGYLAFLPTLGIP